MGRAAVRSNMRRAAVHSKMRGAAARSNMPQNSSKHQTAKGTLV